MSAAFFTRRLRIRQLVFILLLLSGAIPLAISTSLLILENRDLLETQEKSFLTRSALALSNEVSDSLASVRLQLDQLGGALLAAPGPPQVEDRLREAWVSPYLERFLRANPSILALRVLDREGAGPRFSPPDLPDRQLAALDDGFTAARNRKQPTFRFTALPRTEEPAAVLAVPVGDADGAPVLIVEALLRMGLLEAVFQREAQGDLDVFLIDRDGTLLWTTAGDAAMRQSLAASALVRDFVRKPLHLTAEYSVESARGRLRMIGQVSPVEEAGWGVVVHKPTANAFEAARKMVASAVFAALLLLLIAALFALVISRWLGQPLLRLIETTHEMAGGNFDKRLPEQRVVAELADLATDFNRMSGTIQRYIDQLQDAARQNRDLFIGSIRAFAAAIDARDPYTRGHSERVAEFSRAIARHLGQNEDFQQKLWIAALLHDVGKIGIEDRILKKGGVLTAEEFELMKAHPTIGADILAPIDSLREMLPAVRWHHENWNGRGYPHGLRGEDIPLTARIVAVADCFDAITTSRPYQKAYAPRYAVDTITGLAGSRFDAKVVTAFLRAFEAGDIAARLEDVTLVTQADTELPAVANT
ncbi:MAG: HD domain-containing protein [Thermoanaerobaculia bacterium]